jgi:LuxR family transcriptional regulator, maltose regulon positive regulatory protein
VEALEQASDHYPAVFEFGTARLADLRRLQGRFTEAERLLGSIDGRTGALLPWAQLALARGDARAAARYADRLLRRIPETNCGDRLSALTVLLRAHIATGGRERAAAALAELRAVAAKLDTDAARADVAMAQGLQHAGAGEDEVARRSFEDAVDLYARSGVPLDAARARLELADVLRRLGEPRAAAREYAAARGVLEQLGAAAELARAVERFGESRRAAVVRAGRLTRRERDVLREVAAGRTNAEIAARLHLSEHTVKRHVANILTKLNLPTRTAAAAHAVRDGLL